MVGENVPGHIVVLLANPDGTRVWVGNWSRLASLTGPGGGESREGSDEDGGEELHVD